MKKPMFVKVSVDKVVNLSQVADVYVNPYGSVSFQLQGNSERYAVDEVHADYFLSLVDSCLQGYYNKKVTERKDREAIERIRVERGY